MGFTSLHAGVNEAETLTTMLYDKENRLKEYRQGAAANTRTFGYDSESTSPRGGEKAYRSPGSTIPRMITRWLARNTATVGIAARVNAAIITARGAVF